MLVRRALIVAVACAMAFAAAACATEQTTHAAVARSSAAHPFNLGVNLCHISVVDTLVRQFLAHGESCTHGRLWTPRVALLGGRIYGTTWTATRGVSRGAPVGVVTLQRIARVRDSLDGIPGAAPQYGNSLAGVWQSTRFDGALCGFVIDPHQVGDPPVDCYFPKQRVIVGVFLDGETHERTDLRVVGAVVRVISR